MAELRYPTSVTWEVTPACNRAGKTVCTVGYNGDIRACESDTVAYGHWARSWIRCNTKYTDTLF